MLVENIFDKIYLLQINFEKKFRLKYFEISKSLPVTFIHKINLKKSQINFEKKNFEKKTAILQRLFVCFNSILKFLIFCSKTTVNPF